MDNKQKRWWNFPMVWLLISGPAAVVVAGFVTLYIAVKQPDPVIEEDYYRKGLEINKTLNQQRTGQTSMAPAQLARNHAATGVVPSTAKTIED